MRDERHAGRVIHYWVIGGAYGCWELDAHYCGERVWGTHEVTRVMRDCSYVTYEQVL